MAQLNCPVCNTVNSDDVTICQHCEAHLGQAAALAALQARVVRLEQAVVRLGGAPIEPVAERIVVEQEAVTSAEIPPTQTPAPIPTKPPRPPIDWRNLTERWLGRIGVILVIFATIFLFRYAIDQGWLTEQRRVMLGLLAGIALGIAGGMLRHKRPALSRALMGGGIATFYVTGYAAYALYSLISLPLGFTYFIILTLATIVVSFWQDDGMLALLAAFGGFMTPVILSTGAGNALILASYISVLVLGLAIVFWHKGWLILQRVLTYGGWIFTFVAIDMIPSPHPATHNYRLASGGLAVIMLVASWLSPLFRQLQASRQPDNTRPLSLEFGERFVPTKIRPYLVRYSLSIVLFAPFMFALSMMLIFKRFVDNPNWSWLFVILAVGFAVVAWQLSKQIGNRASTGLHLVTAALLAVTAVATFTDGDGDWVFIAFAVAIGILTLLRERLPQRLLSFFLHGFSFILLGLIVSRLGRYYTDNPLFTWPMLANIVAISMIAVGAIFARNHIIKTIYWVAVHLLGVMLVSAITIHDEWTLVAFALAIGSLTIMQLWRSEQLLQICIHALTVMLGMAIVVQLVDYSQPAAWITWSAMAILFAIGMVAFVATTQRNSAFVLIYWIAVHLLILGWLAQVFGRQQGFISIAWGIYAVMLLVISLVRELPKLQLAALLTIGLVVVKLFLVDLSDVEAIWRVLLFLGVGVSLLLLSFFYRTLARGDLITNDIDGDRSNK